MDLSLVGRIPGFHYCLHPILHCFYVFLRLAAEKTADGNRKHVCNQCCDANRICGCFEVDLKKTVAQVSQPVDKENVCHPNLSSTLFVVGKIKFIHRLDRLCKASIKNIFFDYQESM